MNVLLLSMPDSSEHMPSFKAIEHLHRNHIYVIGGLIVGNPDDTRESITAKLEFARQYVDWPYIQHPTPYPRTPMSNEFRERGLIINENLEEYDGTTAVVKTENLTAEEVEFLRWQAERSMKLRHFPAALAYNPLFALRHGLRITRYLYRGNTLRSLLGWEDEHQALRVIAPCAGLSVSMCEPLRFKTRIMAAVSALLAIFKLNVKQ